MAAFTYGGVDFREAGTEYVSPGEESGDGQAIVAEYLTNWADRHKAKIALLGKPTPASRALVGGGNQGYIQRQLPHQYPHPEANWLYATRVLSVRGDGTPLGKDPNGVMAYSDARMRVEYTDLPYDVLSDDQIKGANGVPDESQLLRFIVYETQEKEKQLTYRAGSWKFTTTGTYATSVMARSFIVTEITWLWMWVPFTVVPRSTILGAVGSVNSVAFDGNAVGSLLLRAPRWQKVRAADGTRCMHVGIRADMTPVTGGWNTAPNPQNRNQFDPIVGPDGLSTPYPSFDFTKLFRPGT